MNFASLKVKDRREIIRRVQAENGLNRQIIEKDIDLLPAFAGKSASSRRIDRVTVLSGHASHYGAPAYPVTMKSASGRMPAGSLDF